MGRVMPPIPGATQCPGTPTPAGSEATEDGGQRALRTTSEATLSDNAPAGRVGSPTSANNIAGDTASREMLDAHLDVRVSRTEQDAVRRRARSLGVKPSAWARAVLRDALDERRDHVALIERAAVLPRPDVATAAEVEQLRRLGFTLNGLRRDAATARKGGHEVTVVVDDDLLHRVLDLVDARRAELGDRTRA